MLAGQMMQVPLLVSSVMRHAARHFGEQEIVSRRTEGDIHRYTYRDCEARAKQWANALTRLGVRPGERVGTLAWNGYRHLELYYGTSGAGAVCHTINPRLFAEQVAFIIQEAGDRFVAFDVTFLPLVAQIAAQCPGVEGWIALTDADRMPTSSLRLHCYETLLAAQSPHFDWPELDENTACSLCYTSGTTGHPRGVLYSHRSTVLHAYAAALPDAMNLSSRDAVLPVVPMFHVNAWGLPYAAPMTGAKLVFPGKDLDGKSLYELMENEGVTFSAGVPTVWLGLLNYLGEHGLRFSTLRRTIIGGSACPPAMLRAFEEQYGVEAIHAWGMTELSPLGTLAKLSAKHAQRPLDEQLRLREKQGRVIFGIDMRIVADGAGEGDADGDGDGPANANGATLRELPWDGVTFGNLQVRGPWVAERYFGDTQSALDDGWFATGDIATIDADGFMQITDRSKDVIKSGGEWISSITVENIAMAHPLVAEAACIACAHPRWGERPLLVVVLKPGTAATAVQRDAILAHFDDKIARWWKPDDVVFVDAIPHTATGKIQKLELRRRFGETSLPSHGGAA
ncbi:MAG: 3-(methylthio)propionyl-CoA ligase [Janthinobacterium lividum]